MIKVYAELVYMCACFDTDQPPQLCTEHVFNIILVILYWYCRTSNKLLCNQIVGI